jgi:hypothetical protein
MRSLELLINTYPEKTGTEILEILEKEKQDDLVIMQLKNKSKLELIKEFNEDGCFCKGTFGLNQYFARKFTNFELIDNVIYCDVENIYIFKDSKDDRLSVSLTVQHHVRIDNYGIDMHEKITEKQYNEISEYYENSVEKFWTLIDPTK